MFFSLLDLFKKRNLKHKNKKFIFARALHLLSYIVLKPPLCVNSRTNYILCTSFSFHPEHLLWNSLGGNTVDCQHGTHPITQ